MYSVLGQFLLFTVTAWAAAPGDRERAVIGVSGGSKMRRRANLE